MESANNLPTFVIDASVVVKWHLRDELHVEHADRIQRDYLAGAVNLVAPDHIRYEVPSAIRKCIRTRRLTVDQARSAIALFLSWQLPTVGDSALILSAFDATVQLNCSLYDGLYVALAESTGFPLIHADERLHNAIAQNGTNTIWIEDWQSRT